MVRIRFGRLGALFCVLVAGTPVVVTGTSAEFSLVEIIAALPPRESPAEPTTARNKTSLLAIALRSSRDPVPEKAISALTRCARRGDPDCQFVLGLAFARGTGVIQDTDVSLEWLRKAADGGRGQKAQDDDPEAALLLARYLLDGPASTRDPRSAFLYAGRLGCDVGLPPHFGTTELLTRTLERMDGVDIANALAESKAAMDSGRFDRAFRPILALAEHGVNEAQFAVGQLYTRAWGTTQNLPEAYRWLRLGRAHSPDVADALRIRVSSRLSPTQIETLDRAVTSWQPAPPAGCPGFRSALPLPTGNTYTLPRLRRSVAPQYPDAARLARIVGSVVLGATISEAGDILDLRVLRCDRPSVGFSEAAIDAVSQWKYEPGRDGDRALEVFLKIVIDFKLGR